MPPLRRYEASALLMAIALVVQPHDGVGFSAEYRAIDRLYSPSFPSRTQIFSSDLGVDEEALASKASSMMTLNFFGETNFTSKFAPYAADNNKSLYDFFALPQSAPLLMRGSKNNQVDELEGIDADLWKQYEHMCERLNTSPPSPDDRIFDVTTAAVKFPGLQVISKATIGVKITRAEDVPSYELVLIRDSTYAKGNRLFVWFFNKVTGKDKGKDNVGLPSDNDQTTFSLNKISVYFTEDGVSFGSHAILCVQVRFPSFLMKAIPGSSREKFEKSGGESLRKVLGEDCPVALEQFRQEYVKWLES